MPTWAFLNFQNSVSFVMEQLIFFHDHTMMVMLMVVVLVGYMLINSYMSKSYNLKMFEGQELESIWTVLPAVFLLLIAFPSLRLLYIMEDMEEYDLTVKSLGHQWYWSYEYSDFNIQSFDSYMLSDKELNFRLLDVDNSLLIPFNSIIRVIVSSYDVIHSWTIPSMGVKTDAIPGRLNQLIMMFNRVGSYFGQCSEICGANHSFMPISIFVISQKMFLGMI